MEWIDDLDEFDLPEFECVESEQGKSSASTDCFACQFDALESENDED